MRPLACLPLLAVAAAAAADQAVIIGIPAYLNASSASENGARGAYKLCQRLNYQVSPNCYLVGRQATKKKILQALREVGNKLNRKERLYIYLAADGSKVGRPPDPKFAILPSDYEDGKQESAITLAELSKEIGSIYRAKRPSNVSVILDNAYSRQLSLARSADGFRSRAYSSGGSSRSADPLPTDDGLDALIPRKDREGVCYFFASRASEEALETDIDGKPQSLFTHALLQALGDEKNATYGQVCAAVQTSIAKTIASRGSSRHQTPLVSDEFRDVAVLKGAPGDAKPATKPPKAVWDVIANERPDPSKLQLTVEPNRADLLLGQALRMKVKVGAKGYLVVLWSKDSIDLKIPERDFRNRYEVAQVEPGEYPVFDTPQTFTNPGGNRMTAILFESRTRAQGFVEALSGAHHSVEELLGKGLLSLAKEPEGYTTAGVSFEVGETIYGGFRIANAPDLLAALRKNPYHDWFVNGSGDEGERVLREIEQDPKGRVHLLTLMLNAAIEKTAREDEERPFVLPEDDGLTEEARRHVERARDELKTAKSLSERVSLNGRLLASLFPGFIVQNASQP